MQKSLAVIFTFVLLGSANSLFAVDQSAKIKELEQRLAKLEKALVPILAQQKAKENLAKLRKKARKKMWENSKNYSQKQLSEIEALYQSRGHKWRSVQKTKNLQRVVSEYPKANRAGCAMLYLARSSKGKARENYLKQAIEKYSDCFYGDGVQVGPYAKLLLGSLYFKNGDKKQALKLFKEVKTKFPDAMDHRGINLASMINLDKLR